MFEKGKVYKRRKDIHAHYKGQQQGGICTPKDHPVVFLFTGESGTQYGYTDGWDAEGLFLYTGEGQKGNMEFVRGNKAIRDHQKDWKDILLFETLPNRGGVRFKGQFSCSSWEYRQGYDIEKNLRKTIVFHLVPMDQAEDIPTPHAEHEISLEELKKRAYAAATPASQGTQKEAKQNFYNRDADVKAYVLARAGDKCEACNQPAPFNRPDGTPYLEPHHIRRLSDGGPDHPRWVAGVCPNCHRESHYGENAQALNAQLALSLGKIES